MASFPNADLDSFEGENGDWCRHVSQAFLQNVTLAQLATPGCDPAHAAVAHLNGAIICTLAAGFPTELIQRFREALATVENRDVYAEEVDSIRPHLTVLHGGRKARIDARARLPRRRRRGAGDHLSLK